MQEHDIRENIGRFHIAPDVPESLIVYTYKANLDAILKWVRENNIEKTAQELDRIFHQIIKIDI